MPCGRMAYATVSCILYSIFILLSIILNLFSKIKGFSKKSPLHGVLYVHHEGHEEFEVNNQITALSQKIRFTLAL
jgi:hypothetical protein